MSTHEPIDDAGVLLATVRVYAQPLPDGSWSLQIDYPDGSSERHAYGMRLGVLMAAAINDITTKTGRPANAA